MNKVILQGKVFKITKLQTLTFLKIFTKDYKENFPEVIVYGELQDELANFSQGDFIRVEGKVVTRFREDEEGNRQYNTSVRATNISQPLSATERYTGVAVGNYFDYENHIFLEGTLSFINEKNNIVKMLLNPEGEKFRVPLVYYASSEREADTFMKEFLEDTKVCVDAVFQTTQKEVDGEHKYFDNFTIHDISKFYDIDTLE